MDGNYQRVNLSNVNIQKNWYPQVHFFAKLNRGERVRPTDICLTSVERVREKIVLMRRWIELFPSNQYSNTGCSRESAIIFTEASKTLWKKRCELHESCETSTSAELRHMQNSSIEVFIEVLSGWNKKIEKSLVRVRFESMWNMNRRWSMEFHHP